MDWLSRSAARDAQRPALIAEDVLTYRDFDERTARGAGALGRWGVEAGERVAVWAENDVATAIALWSILRMGAVAVPISPRAASGEVGALCERCGIRLIVGNPDGCAPVPVRAALDLVDGPAIAARPAAESAPALVMSTSGTTGAARDVILTHGNLLAAVAGAAQRLALDPDDRWLAVLPLSHIGGLSVVLRAVYSGGGVVVERRFEAGRVAALVAEGSITGASLVPTMLDRLLPELADPPASLRAVLVGGAPLGPDLYRRAIDRGLPILPTYGMTEAGSQIATPAPGESVPDGSVGRPLAGVDVRITDEDRRPVPSGRLGRVEIRGPAVSPGTWNGPRRPPGDWLRTGDLGRVDEGGFLTVVGRADRTIVTGGLNVDPEEVEQALMAHPGVRDVAVYGIDDAEWGEVVAAAVVTDVDGSELLAHLEGQLARYKLPRRWRHVDAIPRTALGKLDRRRLPD